MPIALAVLLLLAGATAARADSALVSEARAAVARYHENLAAIDGLRARLAEATKAAPQVDALVALAELSFLWGDLGARNDGEKLEAYEQGRQAARRAVDLAPSSALAHFWFATNTARWGQTKGVTRSLFLLPTVKQEIAAVVALGGSAGPDGDPVGIAFAALNVVFFAVYFVWSKQARAFIDVVPFLFGTALVAAVVVSLFLVAVGDSPGSATRNDLAAALAIAVLPGALGHFVSTWPLRWVPANVPPLLQLAIPFIAGLMAWAILGQGITWAHVVGGLLTVVGAAGAIRSPAGRRMVAKEEAVLAAGTELTVADSQEPYYRADLARVQHLGYAGHADSSAPGILRLLEPVRARRGLVVELGCGSGILTRHLVDAGHRVVATDASPAMVALARGHTAGAEEIDVLVLPDDPIRPADAVVSVGHVVNYLPDEAAATRALANVARALQPDGVLALDVCDLEWGERRRDAPGPGESGTTGPS